MNRCPECGKGFDPADPRTFRLRVVPSSADIMSKRLFCAAAVLNALNLGVFQLLVEKQYHHVRFNGLLEGICNANTERFLLLLPLTWLVAAAIGVAHLLCGASAWKPVCAWLAASFVLHGWLGSSAVDILYP